MRSRFQNLEPDRQERLIESAITEFCEHGFEEGSLNRILKNSGMSKSSFYYYFDDKVDIFEEVGRRSVKALLNEVGVLAVDGLTYGTFWSEIEDLLLRAQAVLEQDVWHVQLCRLYYHYRSGAQADSGESPLFGRMRDWIGALVERGREIGVVRSDLPVSLLINIAMGLGEAIDRWTIGHWDDFASAERASLLQREVALFRRILE